MNAWWRDYATKALERPFSMPLIFFVHVDGDGLKRRRFLPARSCLDVAAHLRQAHGARLMRLGSWFWPPDAKVLPDMHKELVNHIAVAEEHARGGPR